jgi:mono/diheme cytochrome c family protein
MPAKAGIQGRALRRMRSPMLLGAALALSGCTDWAMYDLDYFWDHIPVLATMRTSVAYDPYEMPRLPAEGTIPVGNPMGDVPPSFTQPQLDSAAATLTNPYAGSAPSEVLVRGEVMYTRNCAVCHGPDGMGQGSIVGPGRFPQPPPITGAATAARSDGYIYGVITVGRGLMPAYGGRLTHEDRWAVVNYVRQLAIADAGVTAPAPADTVIP